MEKWAPPVSRGYDNFLVIFVMAAVPRRFVRDARVLPGVGERCTDVARFLASLIGRPGTKNMPPRSATTVAVSGFLIVWMNVLKIGNYVGVGCTKNIQNKRITLSTPWKFSPTDLRYPGD